VAWYSLATLDKDQRPFLWWFTNPYLPILTSAPSGVAVVLEVVWERRAGFQLYFSEREGRRNEVIEVLPESCFLVSVTKRRFCL